MVTQLLIADSQPLVRERGRGYFTNRGYAVETAADALECLDRLRRRPPEVLVLERELLWGGGDGVLACLREDRCRWPDTVILTTSQTDGEPPGLEAPLKALLKKPFSLSELFQAVCQARDNGPRFATRMLRHAHDVAAMERHVRQWGPPFGPWRPSSFKGGV